MLAENLKTLRATQKLTQEELAKEMNVSKGAVAMWETGKRNPDLDINKKIASYFNVTIDYLLDKETSTKKDPASDDQIKFALFGTTEVDDELYEDIKKIAKIQQQLKAEKEKRG